MSLLVELQNVKKVFRIGNGDFNALKGIDLQIKKGELVAITGASGSGKSTLMNILGFLDTCTTGCYYFSGEDVSTLAEAQLSKIRSNKIGFVFQSFFLLPRLNALHNVMLPLSYRGVSKQEASEKALEMLKKVNMDRFAHHKPNELSGGQQQRIAIARALVGDPEIILADEPTGALDSKTGQDIMQLLIELHQEGRTILIVTHDHQVSKMCNRIVTLRDGAIMV